MLLPSFESILARWNFPAIDRKESRIYQSHGMKCELPFALCLLVIGFSSCAKEADAASSSSPGDVCGSRGRKCAADYSDLRQRRDYC